MKAHQGTGLFLIPVFFLAALSVSRSEEWGGGKGDYERMAAQYDQKAKEQGTIIEQHRRLLGEFWKRYPDPKRVPVSVAAKDLPKRFTAIMNHAQSLKKSYEDEAQWYREQTGNFGGGRPAQRYGEKWLKDFDNLPPNRRPRSATDLMNYPIKINHRLR